MRHITLTNPGSFISEAIFTTSPWDKVVGDKINFNNKWYVVAVSEETKQACTNAWNDLIDAQNQWVKEQNKARRAAQKAAPTSKRTQEFLDLLSVLNKAL